MQALPPPAPFPRSGEGATPAESETPTAAPQAWVRLDAADQAQKTTPPTPHLAGDA